METANPNTTILEFTADDRLLLELRPPGIRLRYDTYRASKKVNYNVQGYDPFFEGEWLSIVRYDNLRGTALREIIRPTTITQSPFGLRVKDDWGPMGSDALLEKAVLDIREHWDAWRLNYDSSLPAVLMDRKTVAQRNLDLALPLLKSWLKAPWQGEPWVPAPGQDAWLLEQNSNAMNRIDKKAVRGEVVVGEREGLQLLTHHRDTPKSES